MKLKYIYVLGGGYLIIYLLSQIPGIGILFGHLRSYLDYPTLYLNEALFDFIYEISFEKLFLLYGLVNLIIYLIVGLLIDVVIPLHKKITNTQNLNRKRSYYAALVLLVVLCGVGYVFDKVRIRTYRLGEVGLTITTPPQFVRVEPGAYRRIWFRAGHLTLPDFSGGYTSQTLVAFSTKKIFGSGQCEIYINATMNSDRLPFKDWLLEQNRYETFPTKYEDFMANGVWGVKQFTEYDLSGVSESILIPHKGWIFQSNYSTGGDPYTEKTPRSNEDQCRKDFEQVLASFQFDQLPEESENIPVSSLLVNHEEHADWSLYRNDAYGIAFRYPRELKFGGMKRPGPYEDLALLIQLYDPAHRSPKGDQAQEVQDAFTEVIVKMYTDPKGRADHYRKIVQQDALYSKEHGTLHEESVLTTLFGDIPFVTLSSSSSKPYVLSYFENESYFFEVSAAYAHKALAEEILKTMRVVSNSN